jgi:hypothetical protein
VEVNLEAGVHVAGVAEVLEAHGHAGGKDTMHLFGGKVLHKNHLLGGLLGEDVCRADQHQQLQRMIEGGVSVSTSWRARPCWCFCCFYLSKVSGCCCCC